MSTVTYTVLTGSVGTGIGDEVDLKSVTGLVDVRPVGWISVVWLVDAWPVIELDFEEKGTGITEYERDL